jgi:hypothetical protein
MELTTKLISFIGTGGAAIATLWGGATFVDDRYAHAPAVVEVQGDVFLMGQRLENKILTDRVESLRQRAWKLEDRYPNMRDAPATVQEEYRQIQQDITKLDQELDGMQQEYGKSGQPNRGYYERAKP